MSGSGELAERERALHQSLGFTPTESFVELNGLDCTVRVLVAGQGPPIVFVHGGMTAATSWVNLAAALPEYRCILLDRPGCGASEPAPGLLGSPEERKRTVDNMIPALLDGLGIETASVVSNSLGGWYTFRAAAAHPERIDRIVAMGFQVGAPIQAAPLVMRVNPPSFVTKFRPPASRQLVKSILGRSGLKAVVENGKFNDHMLDWMAALWSKSDTMLNEYRSAPKLFTGLRSNTEIHHTLEQLSAVTASTHLFWGDDDIFGGEDVAKDFAALLPTVTIEMVPGAGHAPWIDEHDAAVAAVRAHIPS